MSFFSSIPTLSSSTAPAAEVDGELRKDSDTAEVKNELTTAADNENKEEPKGEEKKAVEKLTILMMALAGPSCAGKTICAVVLQEILAFLIAFSLQAQNDIQTRSSYEPNITLLPITNTEIGCGGQGKEGVILIHQDAYFFPKSFCPMTSFFSAPADRNFIIQSFLADGVMPGCGYVLKWARNCTSSRASGSNTDSTSTGEVPEGADKWSAGTMTGSGHSENATQTAALAPTWKAAGPDSDCWSALNIPDLVNTITETKATGILSAGATKRQEICSLLMTAEERSAILEKYADLISEMRSVVAGRVVLSKNEEMKRKKIRRETCFYVREGLDIQGVIEAQAPTFPSICIVDGFLLFADPNKKDAQVEVHNLEAKHKLMPLFDLKLFLPVSKEDAKHRRFNRLDYIDPAYGPHGQVNEDGQVGGKRVLGQMWKTEGYFNDVAWANYAKEAAWLFKDGDVESFKESDACLENGVKMRPATAGGVEETVRWAVKTLLDELETLGYGMKQQVHVEEDGIEVRHAGDFENSVVEVQESKKSLKTLVGMKLTEYRDMARERIRTLKDRVARWSDGLTKGDLVHVLSMKFRAATKKGRKQNVYGDVEGRDVGLSTHLGSGEVEQRLYSPKRH